MYRHYKRLCSPMSSHCPLAPPGNTAIPVDSLGGLDPTLADAVINGQNVASLLPEDLPISTDVIDPAVVASVLHASVPAGLLPTATRVQISQLPGL